MIYFIYFIIIIFIEIRFDWEEIITLAPRRHIEHEYRNEGTRWINTSFRSNN